MGLIQPGFSPNYPFQFARWHKQFARRLRDPKPLTREEYLEGFECFGTSDFQEGYRAFLEKRKPSFEGK